jgi:hypothetical protein
MAKCSLDAADAAGVSCRRSARPASATGNTRFGPIRRIPRRSARKARIDFALAPPATIADGASITLTATDDAGNTSEFSAAIPK